MLRAASFEASDAYRQLRENAARELAGRPDGAGAVSAAELAEADREIARRIALLRGVAEPHRSLRDIARLPGRPQVPGLRIAYLHPLGKPADGGIGSSAAAVRTG